MEKLNNENAYAILEAGETYQFAGYSWTACEVDKEHHTAVIQSHGVTHGKWPGYVMQKFGGKANAFYGSDIDGEDISAYDDKMQTLYDNIKGAENTSATYGNGLYLISMEKAGFVECGQPGSENYCQALNQAAENARLFGSFSNYAWFVGNVYGNCRAWYVYSTGDVYYYSNQDNNFVVAPAFNLDLSKVEVVGDEIFIKGLLRCYGKREKGSDMSKSRSLYDNPYKYACVCSVPLKLAKIACKKQRHLEKEQKKHPCRCPACGSKHLYYEHGSYEEGYGDYVECNNCGETYDPDEIPNIEYGSLTPFEDFDPVIYFSLTENKLDGWKEACGAETHEEWIHFAEIMIAGRYLSED